MTLQQVIDEIGGAGEMLGTSLAADCLTETAELIASRGGYDIYRLQCGDYFLSHDSGSTHLVTGDDLAGYTTTEARVVGAEIELTGQDLDVVFDNGGGITVQARGFVHSYDNPHQAAEDVRQILAADYDPATWDGDEPEWYQGASPDPAIESNGGYEWRTRKWLEAEMASTEPIDVSDCSGHAEVEFLAALTGRVVER